MHRLTRAAVALRVVSERVTQVKLAKQLSASVKKKVSQESVSSWVTGRAKPRSEVIRACVKLFRIPIAWWYEPAPLGITTPSRR